MNGRNTFKKTFRRMQRSNNTKSVSAASNATFIGVDMGEWRISTDGDGSLIFDNVVTGTQHIFPR